MSRQIAAPNLPQNRVTLCVMSGQYPELCQRVEALGTVVVRTKALQALPEPVRFHADLQMCHLGGNRIVTAPGAEWLGRALGRAGFCSRAACRPVGTEYPNDVRLGALLLNRFCFGNLEAVSPEILIDTLEKEGELVFTPQGYARCSACVLSRENVITSDPSLIRVMKEKGIGVLAVSPGDIRLEGYETGFLGGCCGLLGPRHLVFTGSLERYREGEAIQHFLKTLGFTWTSLSEGPMIDVGGILPLMEEEESYRINLYE